MTDTHSKIIAAAARVELKPLGFQRQGRSRLWVADRGFWLNVVEFTPSRWSKSVTLTNAAHWLWAGAEFMSFNEFVRSGCDAEYETEDQFRVAMSEIAKAASAKAVELDQRFSSFEAVGAFVVDRARSSPDRMGASWWGYEAGIASGLLGRYEDASFFFQGITDERVTTRAAPLLPLLENPDGFRTKVNEMVEQERGRLKLEPLDRPAI
jgi:hypothetical protein